MNKENQKVVPTQTESINNARNRGRKSSDAGLSKDNADKPKVDRNRGRASQGKRQRMKRAQSAHATME